MPGYQPVRRRPAGVDRICDRSRYETDSGIWETAGAPLPVQAGQVRTDPVGDALFRVLVADCNPAVLQVVAMMFTALGCRVSTADGFQAAVNGLAKAPYNLVVCEYTMGRVNGCQLAAYVKAKSPRTCVLIMTGLCQAEVAAEMKSAHIDGWIFKPFGFEELLDVLEGIKLPRACSRFRPTPWPDPSRQAAETNSMAR